MTTLGVTDVPSVGSGDGFEMRFEASTIKHLGLQMYTTLPPVIGELVANAWDAGATEVHITIPTGPVKDDGVILVEDNGAGMSDLDVREKYLVIGRDRRIEDNDAAIPVSNMPNITRPVMGRKGIGKLSGFGVAREIELETVKLGNASRFQMNYDTLMQNAKKRKITFPVLPPTGEVSEGTRITLRKIKKYRERSIQIQNLRRRLARQFSVLGANYHFEVFINGSVISPEERDLSKLLDTDVDNNKFVWNYHETEIEFETGWKLNGWIGALAPNVDDASLQRGIAVFARGKLVQTPFLFEIEGTQPYAFSYLIGELHAEFVDTPEEDTVGTSRSSLIWDTPANAVFLEWGRREIRKIAREWSSKRTAKNVVKLDLNPIYKKFRGEMTNLEDKRNFSSADNLIKDVIKKNPEKDFEELQSTIQLAIDFVQFDAFHELAEELQKTDDVDTGRLIQLFSEWQIVEAKEMMRVTDGRVRTIEKLEHLISKNALEVPDIHRFFKEFPWVMDARWTLVEDEVHYSDLLRRQFPEPDHLPEQDRRIDFLCVGEGDVLSVVEIKRPRAKASMKELSQLRAYVRFMREHVSKTTDPKYELKDVVGYLLVGDRVDTFDVRQEISMMKESRMYVRRYGDLLESVKNLHREFLDRYELLRKAKLQSRNHSEPQ